MAVSIEVFEGFKIDTKGLDACHLQYADDITVVRIF